MPKATRHFGERYSFHIKAVAGLLGHSSISITGDVYGHTSDDTVRAAVDGLAGRLGVIDAAHQFTEGETS